LLDVTGYFSAIPDQTPGVRDSWRRQPDPEEGPAEGCGDIDLCATTLQG
jgi:hypothetical protein